jgi:hypothetical protein
MSLVELLLMRRGADLTALFAMELGDEIHTAVDLAPFKEAGAATAYFRVGSAADAIVNFGSEAGATRAVFRRLAEKLQHALDAAPLVSRSMLESLKARDGYALDILRRWS